jgi:ferredoxin
MTTRRLPIGSFLRIEVRQLQAVIDALRGFGYRTIGPQIVDSAIVYADLESFDQLPAGYIDYQDGGKYRLEKNASAGVFDHVTGPDSLKKYLFPPRETLVEGIRADGSWRLSPAKVDETPLAVIGVRSCDLHALAIQDKVFLGGPYVDPAYELRRKNLFLVAANCRRAAATCFCHSMNTGPAVESGFDLALTEVDQHFVVEVGSDRGAEVMSGIDWVPCPSHEVERSREVADQLRQTMVEREQAAVSSPDVPRERFLDTTDIHDLLLSNLDHRRWTAVAGRCLACANCTLVCPTCFCAAIEEVGDLSGDHVRRERTWDSCFTAEHSYMNTGTVRKSTASRYRQWLTHKLATWIDQFGTSGCVGCGRCITWCPVGIDLTEEVAAIRGDAGGQSGERQAGNATPGGRP